MGIHLMPPLYQQVIKPGPTEITVYEKQLLFGDGYPVAYAANWQAMTFTPLVSHLLWAVDIYGQHIGTSQGNVTVSIKATSGGKPSGGDLASVTVDAGVFSKNVDSWNRLTFATPATVVNGVMYAIVIRYPTATGSDDIHWARKLGDPYTRGDHNVSINSGSTWTTYPGEDLSFQELGTML
jgi:hypothetical protein